VSEETYKGAGVDIEEGEKSVQDIKSMVRMTHNRNVLTDLGSFGGMYLLDINKYKQPVLVSSTDGVGTKLKVAFIMDKHDTVGEDLVNHCVNDIAVSGAAPLFFLDYYATAKLQSIIFQDVISGFVRGCKNNQCALIGGETAEMPDMYQPGEYDLSGTIVGIVEKNGVVDGSRISKTDVLIGLKSNGLHTNGYSLARKVLLQHYKVNAYVEDLGCTVGEELLKVHLSYLNIIQKAINKFQVHGISHITGGGIEGNTKRLLGNDLNLNINWSNWTVPTVFSLIQRLGKVPVEDMRKAFNMGIGLVFIVPKNVAQSFYDFVKEDKIHTPYIVGEVI
jgi:phosphoribosylformylglycinamidine cyclo-ligase